MSIRDGHRVNGNYFSHQINVPDKKAIWLDWTFRFPSCFPGKIIRGFHSAPLVILIMWVCWRVGVGHDQLSDKKNVIGAELQMNLHGNLGHIGLKCRSKLAPIHEGISIIDITINILDLKLTARESELGRLPTNTRTNAHITHMDNIQRAPLMSIDLEGSIEIGRIFNFSTMWLECGPQISKIIRTATRVRLTKVLTTSIDFMMVGQYFLAEAAPAPNVYFPDESVCSASTGMLKCEISVFIGKKRIENFLRINIRFSKNRKKKILKNFAWTKKRRLKFKMLLSIAVCILRLYNTWMLFVACDNEYMLCTFGWMNLNVRCN